MHQKINLRFHNTKHYKTLTTLKATYLLYNQKQIKLVSFDILC